MGDYRGRRRGRADSQPPQDGGYYADEGFGGSNYRDGYEESGDAYPEAQPDGYGPGHTADHSPGYAPDYASDYAEPRFDFGQRPAAYEQQAYGQQSYEQHAYEQQPYDQQPYDQVYEQQPYGQAAYDQTYGQAQDQAYEQLYAPEPTRGSRRGRPAEEPEYIPGYLPGYAPEDLTYEPGYDAPSYDTPSYDEPPYDAQPAVPAQAGPRRGSRRGRPADEGVHEHGSASEAGYRDGDRADYGEYGEYADYGDHADHADYGDRDGRFDADAPHDQGRRGEDRRGEDRAGAVPNHLPVVGGIAAAIIVCGFVTPEAVAAVTIVLQVAAAFAIRDILRLPGRRAAVVAALPAVAATLGTFRFSADVAATAVAAGLGAGFVLAAGDTVLRSRRRGVEPGATRALAGTVAALLFAGLTALLTAAARQSSAAAAIGGVVYGILALLAARDRELTASRAAVLGLPAAGAALAAYAAAILVA